MRSPCPQCGGEVQLRDAEGFPACPFCGAGLVLDRTGVHPHVLYRPRIAPTQVVPLLRRWAGQRRPAPLPDAASPRLVYYPFWRYAREGPRRLVPAWSTLESAWSGLRLPDAEQVFFDAAHVHGAEVIEPSVPEASARARAFGGVPGAAGDLVHLPIFETTVRVGDRRHTVWVEACSGAVVCPALEAAAGVTVGLARRAGWMACGGLVILGAAVAVRPLAVVLLVAGAVAVLLYGVLVSERRGGA